MTSGDITNQRTIEKIERAEQYKNLNTASCIRAKQAIIDCNNLLIDLKESYSDSARRAGVSPKFMQRHGGIQAFLVGWQNHDIAELNKLYVDSQIYTGAEKCCWIFLKYAKRDPYIFMYITKHRDLNYLMELARIFRNVVADEDYELFCLNLFRGLSIWCRDKTVGQIQRLAAEDKFNKLWKLARQYSKTKKPLLYQFQNN